MGVAGEGKLFHRRPKKLYSTGHIVCKLLTANPRNLLVARNQGDLQLHIKPVEALFGLKTQFLSG
jgi:hypothetical protein